MPDAVPANAAPEPGDRALPINLPTALELAHVRPLDIALAALRERIAVADLDRARALWLPTIYVGGDYFRHDGRLQDVAGNVFDTSKGALMAGAGPSMIFAVSDAIFAPLAARQVVRARQAEVQAASNDSLLAVAEAYFNVQQARGDLAGATDAARQAEELLRRTEGLAESVAAPIETLRARTELAHRRQALDLARERWRLASADLARILRLDPDAVVVPLEPPHLQVTLVGTDKPVDDLIPVALMNRPELAAQQALVQATLERMRGERLRPLVPSVLLRGASTNPAGTLGGGVFGGGLNDSLNHFGARGDLDLQVLWQLDNLGLANRARTDARRAEHELALLDALRVQERVAAEVVQAHAQAQSAASRVGLAQAGLRDAVESVQKNFEGMSITKRPGGNVILLLIRPQEVAASIQALAQAYADYFAAIADFNRAQFRLYRALGQPAQDLTLPELGCPGNAPAASTPSSGPVPHGG
jgi:outer membrane protein TolC